MPTFTYPGVYIEELSSGVHSITGVATSIAAFIGWAPQGPTTKATLIESWSDYQALFGGLDARSYLGYSVNQFFANGGTQAYIIRLVWDGSLPAAPGTNPAVAATAVATGAGYASTSITAAQGAITAPPATLSIGTAALQSIAISPATLPPLPQGATLQFTATGLNSDGSKTNPLATASWTSNDPSVAITSSGLATAVSQGTATLTAASGLISGTLIVTVSAAALKSITVTPATPTLPVGQAQVAGQPPLGPTQQLAAIGNYFDGSSQDLTALATWSTPAGSDSTVTASGLVIAGVTAASTTTVTAAWVGVSGTTVVTVAAAPAVLSITIQQAAPVATVGMPVNFTAVAISSDSPTPAAIVGTWTSSNPAVASFTAPGTVATNAPGTTTITITAGAISASTTLTVTSATLNAISLAPINPSVPIGLTLPLKATGIYSDGTTADLTGSIDWTSGGPNATVDPHTGVVKGIGLDLAGVVITATWQTVLAGVVTPVTATVSVAVTAAVLQALSITPARVSLVSAGQTSQFTAKGTFSDATTQDLTTTVTWASSVPAVATIGKTTGLATAVAAGGSLTLFASNPGAWGNSLRVSITPQTSDPTRFGLLVQQITPTGQLQTLESFVNLSIKLTDPSYVVTVINNDSAYVSFINPATSTSVVPTATPSATASPIALSGGADGTPLVPASDQNFEVALLGNAKAGINFLSNVDIFNLLCVPGETDAPTISTLQAYCAGQRAFYIVDSPQFSTVSKLIQSGPAGSTAGPITGSNAANSAYYYPWVQAPDPLFGNRPSLYPPCGFVAGIYAATDADRGVWKAPAGIQASLTGVSGLQYNLTDTENGNLNIQAVNCLRQFKVYGDVVWGARTLQGNDQAGSEWKYIPIRRLALFIESSLYDGTQWVVFEPNDVPLWSQIRLNVGAFLQGLFLQGAFQGTTPQQAYFVKCDAENNPQASIDLGIVNILVGFAPLYPAEFVVIQIQQIAGQVS